MAFYRADSQMLNRKVCSAGKIQTKRRVQASYMHVSQRLIDNNKFGRGINMAINRKFLNGIALAAAVFALSTFVSAQESTTTDAPEKPVKERKYGKGGEFGKMNRFGGKGFRGGRGHNMMRGLRGIDLTEDQKTQIRSLMEANKSKFEASREEMRELMMKKRDGSMTEDEKARFEQFKADRKASAEQIKVTILSLLTPEQTAKLNEMKAEREKRRQEFKQRRMERAPRTDAPKND